EKAVLGALLHDPSKTRAMAGTVAPGDFSSPVLGGLYSLMVGKAASGQPVDPVTLWPAIQADPQLSRSIKSAAMLHDLMEATPTAANAGYYGRQVAEAGQNRRLNNAGERLQQLSEAADMPAGEKLT